MGHFCSIFQGMNGSLGRPTWPTSSPPRLLSDHAPSPNVELFGPLILKFLGGIIIQWTTVTHCQVPDVVVVVVVLKWDRLFPLSLLPEQRYQATFYIPFVSITSLFFSSLDRGCWTPKTISLSPHTSCDPKGSWFGRKSIQHHQTSRKKSKSKAKMSSLWQLRTKEEEK